MVPLVEKNLYRIVAEIHENEPETFLPKDIHSLLDAEPIVPQTAIKILELAFGILSLQYYAKSIVLRSQVL